MKKLIILLKPSGKYLLVIWLIAITTVSSIPHLPSPKIDTGKVEIRLDYLVHFCEYGVLIFLSLLSFVQKDFRLSRIRYILITIAVIVFAVADEFHQKLIPGRTFNPNDILSNMSGIITGLIICYFIFRNIADEYRNNQNST
jgi:VanZ family protein